MPSGEPIFSAVSSNAHNLYTLLQCIGFAPKATVQITPDGIRFSAEESRVVQGLAFLDKALFTSYTFNSPLDPHHEPLHDEGAEDPDSTYYPCFMVSLTALLETLKIFGVNDPSPSTAIAGAGSSNRAASAQPSSSAFTAPALLLDRSCTIQYLQDGSPLSITLSETGVKTTCDLTTYEPDAFTADGTDADIPLQRDAIAMKIIMRSAWLHNAISELAGTNPTVLRLSASATEEPYFSLTGIGGPFSESSVEFSIEQHITTNTTQQNQQSHHKTLINDGTARARATRSKLAPTVTETFLVSPPSSMGNRLRQDYKFALVQKAARAMAVANKVSIRGDRQGVLSLQFMVEFDAHGVVSSSFASSSSYATGGGIGAGGGQRQTGHNTVSFVDFRFVPLLDEESAEMEESGGFE